MSIVVELEDMGQNATQLCVPVERFLGKIKRLIWSLYAIL